MVDTANVLVGTAEITLGVGVEAIVIGYTVDGVTMSVGSSLADIKVEENEGTLIRRLTDQEVKVTLNVAEGALANLAAAIPGCGYADPIVTIGGSALQEHRLTLEGVNPAGYPRVIVLTSVNPTGEVTTPYKKGELSVVPMTFSALVDDSGEFGSVLDAAAVPPVFVSAETDDSGTEIEVTFDVNIADPIGKHLEFWWTRDGGEEAFLSCAVAGAVVTLEVDPLDPILHGEALTVSYALGSVLSAAGGVLASFAGETVTNNE